MSSGASTLTAAWVSLIETALTATSTKCYTHTPQDTSGTYVVLSLSNLPDDTKTFRRVELTIDIDIYSDYKGTKEVTDMGELIYDAAHRVAFTVTGYSLSHPQFQSDRYFDVPSEGSRGVLTFTQLVRPE